MRVSTPAEIEVVQARPNGIEDETPQRSAIKLAAASANATFVAWGSLQFN